MLATHLGASPFAAVDQPLYGMMVRLLDRIVGPANIVTAVHLFNALSGALICGLVATSTMRMSFAMLSRHPHFVEGASRASLFAGVVAGIVLMTSIPFWILSTRSYPDSMGLLLMSLCLVATLRSLFVRRQPWISISSILFGMGLAEFASFIALLIPYILLIGIYATTRGGRFAWRFFIGQSLLILLGFLLILETAWFAWQSPSAAFRGWTSYGEALWVSLKQQHALALKVVPPIGWLSLFAQTYLPLILLLVLRPRLRTKRGPIYLYLVLSAVLIAVLLDMPFLSPLRVLNTENRIDFVFGTPYLAVAISSGLLIGLWWSRLKHVPRLLSPVSRAFRGAIRILFLPALASFLVFLGWRNLPEADGRVSRYSGEWTKAIVTTLGQRKIFVADSWMNTLVSLEAHATGKDGLFLISPDLAGATPYLRWLSGVQEDAQLKSLAMVGVGPLLQGMLGSNTGILDTMAFLGQDTPVAASGRIAFPGPYFFLPMEENASSNRQELQTRLPAHLDELHRLQDSRNPLAPFCQEWLRIQSKLTNNRGVFLGRSGQLEQADEAYKAAIKIFPENISALLNRVEVSRSLPSPPPDLDEVHKEYNDFLERLGSGRYRIWALANVYGTVAAPEAYADQGMYWAISGNPARAVQDFKKAMDMAGEDARLQVALAGAMLAGGNPNEAAGHYEKVLMEDPENREARLGLARVEALRGNYVEARAGLARLAEKSPPNAVLLVDEAVIDLLEGDEKAAMSKANKAVDLAPDDIRAWTLTACLAAQSGDASDFNRAVDRMRRIHGLPIHSRYAIAALLRQQGQMDEARRLARAILEVAPSHKPTLDLSLRMAVDVRDHVTAWQCIPRILEQDPSDSYALMILGTLHYFEHRLPQAEEAFRASLQSSRNQEALNSLAYVLYERNQPEEALPLAEEALALNRYSPETWDTLAMVQMALSQQDPALASIRKAVELAPDNLNTRFHMAMIHTDRNELDEAWEITEQLIVHKARLSSQSQVQLDGFRVKLQRLRESAAKKG